MRICILIIGFISQNRNYITLFIYGLFLKFKMYNSISQGGLEG